MTTILETPMKIKKFLLLIDSNGQQISSRELIITNQKFVEMFGFEANSQKVPYIYKLGSALRTRMAEFLGEPIELYYMSVEWRNVPESEEERLQSIKTSIRSARGYFAPTDNEIEAWLKKNQVPAEWTFEKNMKENNFLSALEELHVMTQVYYGQPIGEGNIIKPLTEARKMLSEGI